ncbi:hypothetical protein [Geobacter sp. DSM 9736]|uniref:hypothetical protein n=1 Tax=Geobacter sp. DSM 9736 TaxID=1277350 RepID=UPI000B511EBF|nr:hypothetical protein [Geobacter sp. DSM 9736]SNB46281.1 hypothetical protein SAMN06269301_1729 [Geobacter sp. DSM 9736]
MNRYGAPAVGIVLSIFVAASANAAPEGASEVPKQEQRVTNAKKAVKAKLEWTMNVQELKEKGYAKKKQARDGK